MEAQAVRGCVRTVRLAELEHMSDEIAAWRTGLPERSGYGIMQALRQCCEAGVGTATWPRNPAKIAGPNPMPKPRETRVFTADELVAIVAEMGPVEAAAVTFAAATGLRPAEWASIERRDVDRTRQNAPRARHEDTQVKARGSAHQDGARRARSGSARLNSRYVFSTSRRSRDTGGAGAVRIAQLPEASLGASDQELQASKPARVYDLRSTFASNALAAGITVFELARIMETSVSMIENYYGTLIDTAHDMIPSPEWRRSTDSAALASAHGYFTALSIVLKAGSWK